MNKKDVVDNIEVAAKMDWDALADTIIELELEYAELKHNLNPVECSKYETLIEIYEIEKGKRIKGLRGYKSSIGGFTYGEDYLTSYND